MDYTMDYSAKAIQVYYYKKFVQNNNTEDLYNLDSYGNKNYNTKNI